MPGIRDDAQDAEGRAASAKLQRRLRHSQYCRAVPAGRELQRPAVDAAVFCQREEVLAAGQPGRTDGRRGVQQRLHRLQRAGLAVFHDAHARAVAAALAKLVTDPEDRPVKRPSSSPSSSSHLR